MKKTSKKIKKQNKKQNSTLIIILVVVAFLLIATVAASFILTGPMDSKGKDVSFEIPEGSYLSEVSEILKDNGLIRNTTTFKIYVKVRGLGNDLKAGSYTMNTNMNMEKITAQLLKGGNRKTTTITIREGLDINRLSTYFEEEGLFTKEEFLAEVKNNFSYYKGKYKFLESVPDTREYPLEGYLFGDTYEIYENTTPKEIITKMLDRFDAVFKEEYYARAKELGYSVDQIVTMASVVEREGILDKELPIIAGVFYNRLNNSMMLQSCATLQYIYQDYQFYFTTSQMQVDNPYNTYKYAGLPAGPISNFRESALKAALYPESTDYLYFCTKNDGTGESAFASSYSEHEANVNKYSSNWSK